MAVIDTQRQLEAIKYRAKKREESGYAPNDIDFLLKLLDQADDRIEELTQRVCDECSPDDYGWNYNAVEGRVPCTCIIESGAYQELELKRKTLQKNCALHERNEAEALCKYEALVEGINNLPRYYIETTFPMIDKGPSIRWNVRKGGDWIRDHQLRALLEVDDG